MRVGSSRSRGARPARGSRGVEQRAVAWPGVQRARAAAEVPGRPRGPRRDFCGIAQPLKLQRLGLTLRERTEDLVCSFSKALFLLTAELESNPTVR